MGARCRASWDRNCAIFSPTMEWVGRKLAVGGQATGTILAAFGTALPESVVTFGAVVFGKTAEQRERGVGAALGGPLVLATTAYAVVGFTLILCRARLPQTEAIRRDFRNLSRDQGWFLAIFVVKIALGLFVFALQALAGRALPGSLRCLILEGDASGAG